MSTEALHQVVQHLRRSVVQQTAATMRDGDLLDSYVRRRDEAAFEAIVRRHGPMVLAVCRRILGNHADAEDAFQATFLILVRKAGSVRQKGSVASWLYGVARHTALKARTMNGKRRSKELRAGMSRPAVVEQVFDQVQALVDEELNLLPDKYRSVLVLCALEGKTIREAATQLGCAAGTVATRLRRGRELLAGRLGRHGLSLSATVLGGTLSASVAPAAVPPVLLASTLHAARLFAAGKVLAGGISLKVAALTRGVLKAMLLSKLKKLTAVSLMLILLGVGAGGVGQSAGSGDNETRSPRQAQSAPAAPTETRHKTAKTRRVLISSEVSGIIVELRAKPGDVVRPGDVLLRVDDRAAKLDVERARERVQAAEAELASAAAQLRLVETQAKRFKNLLEQNAIDRRLYDEALSKQDAARAATALKQANVRLAATELRATELQLTKFTLRSPVSGIVQVVSRHLAEFVKAGEALVEIGTTEAAHSGRKAGSDAESSSKGHSELEAEVERLRDRATWSERMAKLGFVSEDQVKIDLRRYHTALDALQRARQAGERSAKTGPLSSALEALGDRFRYRVPVEIGYTEFSRGGKLEILEVWGTRPDIEVGGQYLVRGKYAMPYHDGGTLCFYLTSTGSNNLNVPELDLQRLELKRGQGEFTLLHGMTGTGGFHLDLQAGNGRIANLYFGTGDNVRRQKP